MDAENVQTAHDGQTAANKTGQRTLGEQQTQQIWLVVESILILQAYLSNHPIFVQNVIQVIEEPYLVDNKLFIPVSFVVRKQLKCYTLTHLFSLGNLIYCLLLCKDVKLLFTGFGIPAIFTNNKI